MAPAVGMAAASGCVDVVKGVAPGPPGVVAEDDDDPGATVVVERSAFSDAEVDSDADAVSEIVSSAVFVDGGAVISSVGRVVTASLAVQAEVADASASVARSRKLGEYVAVPS